jgi:hypothetical protein
VSLESLTHRRRVAVPSSFAAPPKHAPWGITQQNQHKHRTRFISKWRKKDEQQFAEFERSAAERARVLRSRGASARAQAAGEFSLWIETTVPSDATYPSCPWATKNTALLSASLAARWPPGASFTYTYQTQAGGKCYVSAARS